MARDGTAHRAIRGLGALHTALTFVGLLPAESEDHLIKRVIGLPGDQVACCTTGKRLTVNGVEVTESYLAG